MPVYNGNSGNNTVNGSIGDDTLNGLEGNDTLNGLTGNDSLNGGTGNDRLYGDDGDDTLDGGTGNDRLYGGNGDDWLQGGAGSDRIEGGADNDTVDYSDSTAGVNVNLTSGTGSGGTAAGDTLVSIENILGSDYNDSLYGSTADNVLWGGDGNDLLDGGSGNDLMYGDAGNDTLLGGAGNDTMYGGDGVDVVSYAASTAGVNVNLTTGLGSGGYAAGDVLYDIENLTGSSYNDTLTGDNGANVIDGGAGNDVIAGGGGADTLIGGSGTDTADYSASGAGVTVNLATGSGSGGDAAGDVLSQIENVLGSDYADILTGDGNANVLTGGSGADSLYGGAGNDSLYGGDGDDLLQGGAGSDRIEGGAGIDTVDYSDSTAGVNVNLATGAGSGGTAAGDSLFSIENIFGSAYNDSLYGSAGDNFLWGGAGNDLIDGGDGDDTLNGGAGRDTLNGGQGMDYVDYRESNAAVSINLATNTASGGHAQGDVLSGVDGIFGSAFDDTLIGFDNQGLVGDIYTNVFYGGAGNDYMDAGGGNDILNGDEGNDTLIAGAGDDVANGGTGNDVIYGGAGNDTADGGEGNDLIDAGAGNDSVTGGDGDDTIYGGAGNDSLYGGDGNDLISGGDGADVMVGGAGSDTFVGGIGDTIYGGAGDNDVLDLSGAGPYRIIKDPGDPTSGVVQFLDAFGNVIGTLTYSGIDSGIACFTPGTMVETATGPRAIESLMLGDLILTKDRGLQPLRWIGRKAFGAAELQANAALQPIAIRKGALGPGLPLRDMMVSRQHCMLFDGPRAEYYFGEDEVFVRALHLAGQPGILHAMVQEVTYLHLMFDHHEVILADGVWSESFQPASRNIGGLDPEAQAELFAVFADMPEPAKPKNYHAARLTLKAHEARILLSPDSSLCKAA